jgi:hypothetical protein
VEEGGDGGELSRGGSGDDEKLGWQMGRRRQWGLCRGGRAGAKESIESRRQGSREGAASAGEERTLIISTYFLASWWHRAEAATHRPVSTQCGMVSTNARDGRRPSCRPVWTLSASKHHRSAPPG